MPYCFHRKDINRKKLHHFDTLYIYLFISGPAGSNRSFYRTFPFLVTFRVCGIENLEVSEINNCSTVVQKYRELELGAGPDEG